MAFMGQRLIEFGKQGVLVAAAEIFNGFEYFGFYQRNAYLQRSPYSTSLALGKDNLVNVSFFSLSEQKVGVDWMVGWIH